MAMKLIRNIHIFLTAVVLAAVLGSCTDNNGDIGPYYGVWALDRVTIDGTEATSWHDDENWTVWEFQNNIIFIERDWPDGNYDRRVGTWSATDTELVLDFNHTNPEYDPGTGPFAAPEWIYMEPGTNTLQIIRLTNRQMELSNTLADGRKVVYYLRHTY